MSTQPTFIDLLSVLVPECVGTLKHEARKCTVCGDDIPTEKRSGTKLCSRACQHNAARDMTLEMERELKLVARNAWFRMVNRNKALSFDGRYEGPSGLRVVFSKFTKDKVTEHKGVDVHVRPVEPKHSVLTPEDHDHATKQRAFPHSQSMPRAFTSFCTSCIEMVIDTRQSEVRVTRGVYLPIEHDCARVRVYDLVGKLIEVKSL